MALDPNLKDQIDPQAWEALKELDARIEALESRPELSDEPPTEHSMKWADGTSFEGQFYKGKPNGKGKCTTADGERSRCKYKSGVLVE